MHASTVQNLMYLVGTGVPDGPRRNKFLIVQKQGVIKEHAAKFFWDSKWTVGDAGPYK